MRKLFLLVVLFIVAGYRMATAQELVESIATVIANQRSYVSDYDSEFKLGAPGSDLTWTARHFSNNNSGWNDIRCGSKASATVATITTDFAISASITLVEVDVTRYKSTGKMNSMTLLVSSNADMSDATAYDVDISDVPTTMGESCTLKIPITKPEPDRYYEVQIDMPKVSSAGVFSVNTIRYYKAGLTETEGADEGTLNFNDSASLQKLYVGEGEIAPGGEYGESATNNLNGAKFSIGAVMVTIEKGDGGTTPRWWSTNNITPELRINIDNTMTFEVTQSGCRLREIKFIQGDVNESYFNNIDATEIETNLGASAIADKKWDAPETGKVTNVKMTFKDYSRAEGVRITYIDEEKQDAIEEIWFDEVVGEVEYFNLQGCKVGKENLTPGIYIRSYGRRTEKVLVK